jgi:hypothetical protein
LKVILPMIYVVRGLGHVIVNLILLLVMIEIVDILVVT